MDGEIPSKAITSQTNGFLYKTLEVIGEPYFVIILIMISVGYALISRNKSTLAETIVKQQKREYMLEIYTLQAQIKSLQDKLRKQIH
jgi:hypothetical protein